MEADSWEYTSAASVEYSGKNVVDNSTQPVAENRSRKNQMDEDSK
jgi:hypothetical protein